jgi:acyl-CoA synthetase (AMP-forming)/AMP-acid ligase II
VPPVAAPPTPATRVAFATGLARFGGRTALLADGEAISYADLAGRVEERAEALGTTRRLVLVTGGNDVETLVSHLGALAGGHVSWLAPERHAGALAEAFRPDVVASVRDGVPVLDEHHDGSAHDLHPDLAQLLGTSGTTGAPRLVRLSARNVGSNAAAIAAYLGIGPDDRAVTTLPMHYCYGLSVVHSHLHAGACLVLTDRSVTDPAFPALLRDAGATSFAGVPHTFDLLERAGVPGLDAPTLRYVTQAGGRLAPERVRRFAELGARCGWRFVVMYGQTEATARMAYLPPELAAARPQAIGVPIPGGAFVLRPLPGDERRRDGIGELVYRGPNVMLGYAHEPADLALGRTVHELATGDLARRAPDGLWEIVGRRSRFLKILGLRIDLDEVERRLRRDGAEAMCAGTDERLVVAIGGPGRAPAGLARLLAVDLGLPPARVEVRALDALPRLPSGKPDYAALLAPPAGGGESDGPVAAAAGEPLDRVRAAFRDVLGVARVGDGDSFASLGGDSLSYVEMCLALEEAVGHLPHGWPERTVADLAAAARPARGAARVESNVVLRAAAIVLVVASHMTAFWPAGGAHLLLALAGHSFARFSLAGVQAPRRLARAAGSIARIAVPASLWIGLQVVLAGGYSVGAVVLVNNYTGAQSHTDGRWHYWFVEALVQILIVLAALFSVPAVRRLERARPFAFVLALLGAALLFRFEVLAAGADDNLVFRPHAVVWIFLLGWAVHRATSPARRAAVTAAVLLTVPGFFGDPVREAIVAGGVLLLLWLPAIPVPRLLVRPLGLVAAASLAIYLTHWQVFPPLADRLPVAVALPVTVAAGIAAWWCADRASRSAAPAARAAAGRLRVGVRSSVRATGSIPRRGTAPRAGRATRSNPARGAAAAPPS